MRKHVLYVALLMPLLLLGFCAFAQDGTPANPYPISNKEALVSLAQCINKGQNFSFENGIFVFNPNGSIHAGGEGVYFRQTADIDLNGETWFPIGNSLATGFRGVYLGN